MNRTGGLVTLYHVTSRSRLASILSGGLVPRLDTNLGAVGLSRGRVVNLVPWEGIGYVAGLIIFRLDVATLEDVVILEVDVSPEDIQQLTQLGVGFRWYISRKRIPPGQVSVFGTLNAFRGLYNLS